MNKIEQFTFFKNYFEIIEELENENDKKDLIFAIVNYIFKDIEPTLNGTKKIAWLGIKTGLITSKNRAWNAKSKQNQNKIKTKSKQNQKEIKTHSTSTSTSTSTSNIKEKEIVKRKNQLEDYNEIIDYLNLKTNSSYKSTTPKTRELIKARYNEGFTLDDFKRVIDNKVNSWGNDEKMVAYLRPETLFSNKFESYLNEKVALKKLDAIDRAYLKMKESGEIE
jgi:uncharacterized phage protein (TIGR02220 family)